MYSLLIFIIFSGNELIDGIFGSLIVRRPDKLEQQRSLYDIDDPHHVIILNEWGNAEPVAPYNKVDSKILVNGISYSSVSANSIK